MIIFTFECGLISLFLCLIVAYLITSNIKVVAVCKSQEVSVISEVPSSREVNLPFTDLDGKLTRETPETHYDMICSGFFREYDSSSIDLPSQNDDYKQKDNDADDKMMISFRKNFKATGFSKIAKIILFHSQVTLRATELKCAIENMRIGKIAKEKYVRLTEVTLSIINNMNEILAVVSKIVDFKGEMFCFKECNVHDQLAQFRNKMLNKNFFLQSADYNKLSINLSSLAHNIIDFRKQIHKLKETCLKKEILALEYNFGKIGYKNKS